MSRLIRQLAALLVVSSLLVHNVQAQQQKIVTATTKVRIRKKTVLKFTVVEALDSGTSKVGDVVHLRLTRPLVVDGATVLQKGHEETGKVKKVTSAGPGHSGAVLLSVDKVHFDDGSSAHAKFWFAGPEPLEVPDRYVKPALDDGTGEAIAGLTEAVIFAPIVVPVALYHLPGWIHHKATEKPEPRNTDKGLDYHLPPGAGAAIVVTEDHQETLATQ